ncbi:hypothetical protein [Mucilaginibacter ginsenosidivorax]|uniref:Uncharacterized protein n=1 Tax=Mucilaginibacter ginsenosidivorax TaxID=862126 RepID=A0A5B8VUI9_9SPHI|nr:hypothetical protein [Mucilaginibacter ginsenosidivorax]QEC75324.1 hypothetical protein FSB76_04975 [Mucilaginibacter ginsenosidivorax]
MITKTKLPVLLLTLSIFFNLACKQPPIVKHNGEKDLISFKPVWGVAYSEISRHTANGLSFTNYGYQMEPQWRINFVSNDSASIYSPTKGKFINFPLTRGYDSIFNTARTWLKVKAMNRDSLKLEIINSYGDTVDKRGTKIYMTFYADNYIKNTLHTDTAILKRANHKDSLFIKRLSDASNKDYTKAFAARQPATLSSTSHKVKVKKWIAEGDLLNHFDTSDDYMNPTFDIAITKAYADFYYSFSVYIDADGQMHYNEPLIPFLGQSLKDNYIHQSTAVMNGYLKHYLKVTPGKTLNMLHASKINIHVQGITGI